MQLTCDSPLKSRALTVFTISIILRVVPLLRLSSLSNAISPSALRTWQVSQVAPSAAVMNTIVS
jgi:hypothetical protein